MTDEEIIKKALIKAFGKESDPYHDKDPYEQGWTYNIGDERFFGSEFDIIFSHDFAKAFWGEWGDDKYTEMDEGKYISSHVWDFIGERWQWNLQQMVLEKDPIKYLGKFL